MSSWGFDAKHILDSQAPHSIPFYEMSSWGLDAKNIYSTVTDIKSRTSEINLG